MIRRGQIRNKCSGGGSSGVHCESLDVDLSLRWGMKGGRDDLILI